MHGLPPMARALMYALAQIWIEGQFAQWGGEAYADAPIVESLDNGIGKPAL